MMGQKDKVHSVLQLMQTVQMRDHFDMIVDNDG